MRVLLSDDAVPALKRLQERFKRFNDFVEMDSGPFVSHLIRLLESDLPNRQVKRLAPLMVPSKTKMKLMQERLLKIAAKLDEKKLARLEKQVNQFTQETQNVAEKPLFSAEKDANS